MSSEQRSFVFSLTFIVVFSLLLATMPVGLQGPGDEPDMPVPIDPNLIADFSATHSGVRSDFSSYQHAYDLGGRSWLCISDDTYFRVVAKILFFGILWLGGLEYTKFISKNGVDRGETLTMAEIEADALYGAARYSLQYVESGNSAGGFVTTWNTTAHATPSSAWMANVLYLVHGVGIDTAATMNIGVLLLSLLMLQLPDVPLLVNVLIAVPIWAGIVYVVWFIIKEMIPFV